MGWLTLDWDNQTFWRRCRREQVCGLPLLRVEVPVGAGRSIERKVRRAARLLARMGCRRVLAEAGFSRWPVLEQWGLRRVEAENLCRAMAAELVLAELARQNLRPGRATVELRCQRVDRAAFLAAEALCPQVRQMVVYAPVGGAELGDYLRAEYGVAAVERGKAHVTVCLSPTEGEPEGALRLYGPRPDLGGLALLPRALTLPAGIDPLALTALLWEEGRVPLEEITVIPT